MSSNPNRRALNPDAPAFDPIKAQAEQIKKEAILEVKTKQTAEDVAKKALEGQGRRKSRKSRTKKSKKSKSRRRGGGNCGM